MKKSSLMGRRNLFDLVERSLGNSPVGAPVDEKFIERVKALWQSRLDVAKASKKPEEFAYELAMFGGTMVNGNFDLDWALPFLLEVLKVGGYVEHSSQVIQMLAAVVAERTDMVTECLYLMVKDTPQGQAWRYLTSKDDLSKILVRALAAGPDTADKAVKAIHLIGERGCDDFVGLLNLGKGRS
jgi:hypothetical protein